MIDWAKSAAVAFLVANQGIHATSPGPDPYVAKIKFPQCTTANSRAQVELSQSKTNTPIYLGIDGIFDADDGPADCCKYNIDFIIALNAINNQTDILPTRNLYPIIKDDQGSSSNGFLRGMEFCGLDWASTPETITTKVDLTWNSYVKKVDIVVGPHYSGISMNMATILGYFEINNVSPVATNPGLSDDSKYPFFNRVVSNDASQAHAVLALCKFYGWKKLLIAHTTTAYSTGFANAILAIAMDYSVSVDASVAWETGAKADTLVPQVNALIQAKAKVIMCTAHDPDCTQIRVAAETMGIADYPYMWMYGDSSATVSIATVGCLVTQPYSPLTGSVMEAYDVVRKDWKAKGKAAYDHVGFSYYARDSVYASAIAFDIYFKGQVECAGSPSDAVKAKFACAFYDASAATKYNSTQGYMIRWILRNRVSFEGASGLVEFNRQNGDRRVELWSIFNCKVKGQPCEKVGMSKSGEFEIYAGKSVAWPGGKDKIVAWPVTEINWTTFGASHKAATIALLVVTWLLIVAMISASIFLRKRPIMRMSSYKINAITVLGAGLCVASLYAFIFDEKDKVDAEGNIIVSEQGSLNNACVAFPVLLCLGFSMYFGSMGVKLWRVKQIFREEQTLKKMHVSDFDLFLKIFQYVLIEMIVVVIWMVMGTPKRAMYSGPELPTSDPMLFTIERFGYCSSDKPIFFYIILVFNVLTAFVVSTWAYEMRNVFYKAVNDSMQIAHITLLLVVFGGFLTALCFFLPRPTHFFVFLLAGIIIIAWFSIGMIYFTKLYAIATGAEQQWTKASVMESVVGGASTANSVVPSSQGSQA